MSSLRRRTSSAFGWAGVVLLAGSLIGLFYSLPPLIPEPVVISSAITSPDASHTPAPSSPTLTPFRPQQHTATAQPTATAIPTATASPTPEPHRHFADAMTGDGDQINIEIEPPDSVNRGKPVIIRLTVGDACDYGLQRACSSLHRSGSLLLLTVHSGLGAEGERFRQAVEGLGINQAAYSLAKIQANLAGLEAAPVSINDSPDYELVGVARVPPARLNEYLSANGDDALALAGEYNPAIQSALQSGEDLLAFEICGWQLPGEPAAEGVTPTTASIYLGVIRDR